MGVYRKNAGAVVFNKDKKILLCRRLSSTVNELWQFPQGGIDDGETPAEAAARELEEETGITSVKRLMSLDKPIRYNFPEDVVEKFKTMGRDAVGQDQYWSLFYFYGDDSEIDFAKDEVEFNAYEWVSEDEPVKRAWHPKIESYKTAMEAFIPIIKEYEI
ncbi:MAG: RNA pyrophosphohydrolase [Lactobacillus sp.]|jgi:putative (di)nucleoside polyphosphate hydrolase|nr:RNA pyrophosphohydrolase [Lactobacillus sp.]